MILQRTRPPLLETPFEADGGVFTPNDQFYVRWQWALIPTEIDTDKFSLTVRGHVNLTLSLSLNDILQELPSIQPSAVNQCSGNSRGFFQPRVPGGGNALWTGVRLKDVLDKAGVKPGAAQERFKGLEEPVVAEAPHFHEVAGHRPRPRRRGDDRLCHECRAAAFGERISPAIVEYLTALKGAK
jgi:DMSO/TMAO reductase YedYZ molybdopterin-dependent catalytic subunit